MCFTEQCSIVLEHLHKSYIEYRLSTRLPTRRVEEGEVEDDRVNVGDKVNFSNNVFVSAPVREGLG
jgi:hypothetical protein